jgi:glycosyltransferase involved in cell wall biosynthesis
LEKHLHIISFNVPFPADYGGAVDVFYKIKALAENGVNIHLHCFDYGRGEQPILTKYCNSVQYYERFTGHKGISNTLPYIVASRKNEALLQDLLKDNHPVLMEGVHCTCPLLDKRFDNRNCFVRLHNVEHTYYYDLRRSTSSPLKKLYYWLESRLLKSYEKKIAPKAAFMGITGDDTAIYKNELGCKDISVLPLFIPDWQVQCPEGMGCYCLYHGDLSVAGNEKAALWLIKEIFSRLHVPFVIAGKNPSEKIYAAAQENGHTCIVANPSDKEIQDMIAKAHINVLPSYTTTGIKIKLVNALFNGRHCVVNDATVVGSGLESACHIGTNANAFREIIAQLYHQPFAEHEIELRKRLLGDKFCNNTNAKKMISTIWKD